MKHRICAAALALPILVVAGCAGGTSLTNVIPRSQPQMAGGALRLTSVAQVEIKPLVTRLPLGQTMPVAIIAEDVAGHVVTGAFRNAIVLHGENLSLSSTRITNALEGIKVTASWKLGFAGSSGRIIAQPVGGRAVSINVASSTGFVYYSVGNNPNTDDVGFQMTVGPDGKLYYGTLGYTGCPSACTITDGAIARFDPATGKSSEIEVHAGVIGLLFTSDGALWFGGGSSHQLFRLPPKTFSAKKLQTIAVPPVAGRNYSVRSLAEDGNQQVWFTDSGGSRIFKIPAAGPYKTSSLTAYSLPNGPAGTPGGAGFGQGIAYGQDGNLYVDDFDNGIVDQVSPATGATTAQLIPPQQKAIGSGGSVYTRFIVTDAGGRLFTSLIGANSSTPPEGDVDTFLPPSQKVAAIKLPSTPAGSDPDSLGVNGANLYYADLGAALGLIDTTSYKSRLYPVAPGSATPSAMTPNGIGAMPDGTTWFTCYGAGTGSFTPLCLGHTVYTSGWSLEPGPAFTIVGFGSTSAQPVGIMESPSSNSGPFTVKNDNKAACQVSKVVNHNFVITGLAAGTCNLTVKDAQGISASIVVTVQSSSAQKRFGPFAL